jgi:hypothetical protein
MVLYLVPVVNFVKTISNAKLFIFLFSIPVKKDPLRGWSDNIANQTQIAARALMKKATKTANNKNKGMFYLFL